MKGMMDRGSSMELWMDKKRASCWTPILRSSTTWTLMLIPAKQLALSITCAEWMEIASQKIVSRLQHFNSQKHIQMWGTFFSFQDLRFTLVNDGRFKNDSQLVIYLITKKVLKYRAFSVNINIIWKKLITYQKGLSYEYLWLIVHLLIVENT